MTLPGHDAHRMILKELAVIRERVHKLIPVRELAALHKLEQIKSERVLKWRATWITENDFDRIEFIADRHEETLRRLLAGFDPETFYTGLYNP